MESEAERLTIIIDASNVCWGAATASFNIKNINRARPPLLGLVLCLRYFESLMTYNPDFSIVAVAPDWWQRESHMDTDDETSFLQLLEKRKLVFAPKKTHDDLFILALADQEISQRNNQQCYIVSNDLFRDHMSKSGLNSEWYQTHRIPFSFEKMRDYTLLFVPDCRNLPDSLQENEDIEALLDDDDDYNGEEEEEYFQPGMWKPETESTASSPFWEDHVELDPQVWKDQFGYLIGAQGERIKTFQDQFGVDIQVFPNDFMVVFRGLNQDNLIKARSAFLVKQQPTVKLAPRDLPRGADVKMQDEAGVAASSSPADADVKMQDETGVAASSSSTAVTTANNSNNKAKPAQQHEFKSQLSDGVPASSNSTAATKTNNSNKKNNKNNNDKTVVAATTTTINLANKDKLGKGKKQ